MATARRRDPAGCAAAAPAVEGARGEAFNVGLTIRSLDSEQRVLQGLATTPETDLLGDRVNPRGAKYQLPLPLLLFHDHQSPVGEVVAARSTDDGIEITAQIARLSNDGEVKRMCDRAWDLVRSKLIKGLSIGFKAIEREVLPDGGYYFKSWQWLELSLVTVAAQPQARSPGRGPPECST